MGHRANYAILENGRVSLYYSHWGALTISEDMFWGPSQAEEFIKQLDQGDEWLDDVWGEGGVAFDKDDQVITLFGLELLAREPHRATFLALMRGLWASFGWQVQWAEAGMPAIAAAVGKDPSIATAKPRPPVAVDLDEVGPPKRPLPEVDYRLSCLITTLRGDQISHVVSDQLATGLLANGPEFLTIVDRLPPIEVFMGRWSKPEYFDDEPWSLGDEFTSSMIVDLDANELAFRELYANEAASGYLSLHWKGWELRRFKGQLDAHFARLGVAIPEQLIPLSGNLREPSELDESDVIRDIATHLFDKTKHDEPMEMMRAIAALEEEDGTELFINPEAMKAIPRVGLDDTKRHQLWGKALQSLTANEQSK